MLNRVAGGSTGLAGILPVIWSSVRGWRRDEQLAVFQPSAVASFLMCLAVLGATGVLSLGTVWLFAAGLPCLLLGTLAGWSVYGKLDESGIPQRGFDGCCLSPVA